MIAMDFLIQYHLLIVILALFPLRDRDIVRAELNALCLRRGMTEEQAEKYVGKPGGISYLFSLQKHNFHGRLKLNRAPGSAATPREGT
jgi:hypothetical protein